MPEQGCFVISDITGYTAFLTQSELDHAHLALNMIFDSLIDNFKPPLQISNYQGDAILSYAPSESALKGQAIIDCLESIYSAFIQRRDEVHHNATCDCRACQNIPTLDLKLFVHHGEYVMTNMRGKQELSGKDVIIAHRIMKNDVKEKTGVRAYALFTESAVSALDLTHMQTEMIAHSETYDHIGEIKMYVYDLNKAKVAD